MSQYIVRADEPYQGHVQSIVNPDGTIAWSDGLTVDTYEAANGFPIRVIDDAELEKLDSEYVASMITAPVQITEQRFWDMLEVLPPCRWHTHRGVEMFHVVERITHDLVSWLARIGEDYFECVDRAGIGFDALAAKFHTAASWDDDNDPDVPPASIRA